MKDVVNFLDNKFGKLMTSLEPELVSHHQKTYVIVIMNYMKMLHIFVQKETKMVEFGENVQKAVKEN